MKIVNRWNGNVIIEGDYNTQLEAIAACIKQGKSLSNANLSNADLSNANLSNADLSNANLSNADLSGADLSGANLFSANLFSADLFSADLFSADLSGADLFSADLSGADLSGADLSGANLSGANLSGTDLSGADLQPIRDDIWAVLSSAPQEVAGLIIALKTGRVDGSTYEGDCCCLVGTLANELGCDYEEIPSLKPSAFRPAERFFAGISEGDTPETSQFSALAVQWCEEWLERMQAAFGSGEEGK